MSTIATPSSNANGANDISLSKQLAEIDSLTNYPATDLVKELLKFHQADVGHKRNIHMSAQVLQRSRTAYEEINGLITKVDQSGLTDQQEPDFDSWEKYTDAIPSLEDVLLQYFFKFSTKARQHVHDEGAEVIDGIHFIAEWNADREMLNNLTKSKLTAEYITQRTSDDQATYTALAEYFKRFNETNLDDKDILDRRRGDKPVQSVRNIIKSLTTVASSKPYAESTLVPVIQTFMLFVVPFSLLNRQRPKGLKVLEDSVKQHLASMNVWNTMKNLATVTLELANAKPGPEQEPHAKKWKIAYDVLEKLLVELGTVFISLAEDLLDLIKLSARIRSPFHERTIGLVKILRGLDLDTRKLSANHRRQLQETMKEAFDKLTKASNVINKDVTKAALEDTEYQARTTELKQLLGSVEKTSTNLKLEKPWAEREQLFTLGVATDEGHLKRMKAMFAAARAPPVVTPNA
ncbi:hypothetical protein CPB83DRAFT_834330 [Crepidotus variabilis]|uniref:Uncharacterized protein n=1 Tax=Crepidotus variabilis TaxID=179855 RepID=A0A9P6JS24_9AGAR|nr:hypothetical protein CPB83DRAFT_834330 [Crepidotus variabilis]